MKKFLILVAALISFISATDDCNTKRLIYHEWKGTAAQGLAWGHFEKDDQLGNDSNLKFASGANDCEPLSVRDEHGWVQCCYIEINYKYQNSDHTAKGCYPVSLEQMADKTFDAYENKIKSAVTTNNTDVTGNSVKIECAKKSGSSFIKVSSAFLLIFSLLF